MVLSPFKLYLDIAGTDYSAKILGLPSIENHLSASGRTRVILSNKGGQYKSTFSQQQRVAVAAARSAFHSQSDFFTGTDGAAPNAKWTLGGTVPTISGNTLKCSCVGAGSSSAARSGELAQPFTFIVYAKASASHEYAIQVFGYNVALDTQYWGIQVKAGGSWSVGTRQGGAYAERANGGTYAVNTWYLIEVRQTSATSVTIVVYDVFGNVVYSPGAQTFDSQASVKVHLGTYNATCDTYFDSFLCWSVPTVQGEQLFEGYIDQVTLQSYPSGDTVILDCVNDVVELEQQYDDAYGSGDSTFTPTCGATNDMNTVLSASVPSDWSVSIPNSGIHDFEYFSQGTTRLPVIIQVLQIAVYLGFYVLPMKVLCTPIPDRAYALDLYTNDDAANWTTNDAAATDDATFNIEGTKCLRFGASGAGTKYAFRAVNFGPVSTYPIMMIYCGKSSVNVTDVKIRLYTDTATPKYWQYTVPIVPPVAVRSDLNHYDLPLPDADGLHDWTATNSPSISSNIVRIYVEYVVTGANQYLYLDSMNFYARKPLTSKYTVSNIISGERAKYKTPHNSITVVGTGFSVTSNDTTLQTRDGLRAQRLIDLTINNDAYGNSLGQLMIEHEYQGEGDPITLTMVNPSGMYLLRLGDTCTMTVNNLNLSNATRTLTDRVDRFGETGWQTELVFGAPKPFGDLGMVYTLLNAKRR